MDNNTMMRAKLTHKPTLEKRIQRAVFAVASLAVLTAFALFFTLLFLSGRDLINEEYKTIAQALEPTLVEPLKAGDQDALTTQLGSLKVAKDVSAAKVRTVDGAVIATYTRGVKPTTEEGSFVIWSPQITLLHPIFLDSERVGVLEIRVTPNRQILVAQRYTLSVIVLFVVLAGLVMVLARRIANRLITPLATLEDAITRITKSGDYTQHIEIADLDEFGGLSEAFNAMLKVVVEKNDDLQAMVDDLRQARDDAAHASTVKSRFLANMSHEIRTPLNAVLGMAQILEREDLTDRQRKRVHAIARSGESLMRILNDILDISKVEAGKIELEHIAFSVDDIVTTTKTIFKDKAQQKGLDLNVHVDDTADRVFKGDPTRIRQVLSNLVSNAIKFTDEGSVSVTVTAGPAGENDPADTFLHFEVRDTGDGLSPEAQADLFTPFTQSDASINRTHGGTGLGLTICRELTSLMGGDISVESTLGEGAAFRFRVCVDTEADTIKAKGKGAAGAIPAQTAAASSPDRVVEPPVDGADGRDQAKPDVREEQDNAPVAAPTPQEPSAPDATPQEPSAAADAAAADDDDDERLSVLVAEDNENNREVLSALLEPFNMKITFAFNGQEAVEQWEGGVFDLVFMDIQMPIMDGVAAASQIRAMEASTGRTPTPIVALTANVMSHQVAEYHSVGMNGCVGKPVNLTELIDVVHQVLGPQEDEDDAATG